MNKYKVKNNVQAGDLIHIRMDEVFTLIYDCDHQEVFAMSTDDIRQVLRYILKNPSLQL